MAIIVATVVAGVVGWIALEATSRGEDDGVFFQASRLSTAAKVRQAVFRERVDLLPYQTDYLFLITESDAKFLAFYQKFCDQQRSHPLLDSDKLDLICAKGGYLAGDVDAKQ